MIDKEKTVILVKGHGELGSSVRERLQRIRKIFEGTESLKDKRKALVKLKSLMAS